MPIAQQYYSIQPFNFGVAANPFAYDSNQVNMFLSNEYQKRENDRKISYGFGPGLFSSGGIQQSPALTPYSPLINFNDYKQQMNYKGFNQNGIVIEDTASYLVGGTPY